MADKPIYYGSSKSSPMYYGGRSSPMYYGGKSSPMYYGSKGVAYYGSTAYGGAYGMPYGGAQGSGDDGSVIGKITPSRILRVISQRWLSIFVFLLVGLIVAFAIYRVSPTVYEATSEFSMDMRRSSASRGNGALAEITPDYGSTYVEIFNTRISDWRSEKVFAKVIQQYRTGDPNSTVSDEELIGTLAGSTLDLVRNSRIITITVESKTPKVCAALANAYAEAIEAFTDEENKRRCDKAVAQIHSNVEKRRREVDEIAKKLLSFRSAKNVDSLRSRRETISTGLTKTTGDILALETEETQLVEWEKMLEDVQKNPSSYGNLSTGVPRAQEIAQEFRTYQDADNNYQKLLFAFTDDHPDVINAKKAQELGKQRFLDAAARALLTGRSTLRVARNRLVNLKKKQEDLGKDLVSVEQQIVLAESGLGQLEAEFNVANRVLEGLIMDENKARMEAESNNEIVRVGRPAGIPSRPVRPNPTVIFGLGIALSFVLGIVFVLVVDNLEDTVINLADLEGRLALKVLAILPHVRRKKREEVARSLINDKYSQFAEVVAGLRNLLDSPRYEAVSHCLLIISTQPGEGKTITSTSIAIAYAQAGRRTLHVDFDMRRPRLARVWGIEVDKEHSFSHFLQSAGGEKLDFDRIVNKSDVPGLDVIVSAPPEGVTPSSIFGSTAVSDFFEWARSRYDHVVVDAPPYGLVGDVVSLSVMVDSVIVMCCPDRTHFRPIQHCVRTLTEAGANIIGSVVNDIETSSAGAFMPHSGKHRYGGKYGYGYGNGYGYGDYRPNDDDESAGKQGKSVEKSEFEKATDDVEARISIEDKGITDEE